MSLKELGEGRSAPADLLKRMVNDPNKYGNFALGNGDIPGDVNLMLPSCWITYRDENGVVATLPYDMLGNALIDFGKKEDIRHKERDEEVKEFAKLNTVEQLEYLKKKLDEKIQEEKEGIPDEELPKPINVKDV